MVGWRADFLVEPMDVAHQYVVDCMIDGVMECFSIPNILSENLFAVVWAGIIEEPTKGSDASAATTGSEETQIGDHCPKGLPSPVLSRLTSPSVH